MNFKMTLLQKIRVKRKEFRKAILKGDKSSFNLHMVKAITTLLSDAERPGLDDGKRESTDAEVVKVVQKTISGITECLNVEYDDLKHAEMNYITNEFLPQQMTDSELEDEIIKIIHDGVSNMGQIMGKLKANFSGKYDGKTAAKITKELLS